MFSKKPFDEAKAEAEADDKLFVLDATAVWCAPCRMMDKMTWSDESVESWIADHAIAVKVDVDEQRDLARAYGISAMPTVIAIKGRQEIDRVVGYRTPDQLIRWLNDVRAGRTDADARDTETRFTDGRVDINARMRIAETHIRKGEYEEATEDYLWLWDNMLKHNWGMSGVRVSFMAGDMERLARQSDVARAAFTKLRDRYGPRIKSGQGDYDDLVDWVTLNEVIGDEDQTLVWFDEVKDDPKKSRHLQWIDNRLFRTLIDKYRWADAGRLFKRLDREVKTTIQRYEEIRELDRGRVPEGWDDGNRLFLHQSVAELYATALAADRDDEAAQVAAMLFEYAGEPASYEALLEMALRIRQARPIHRSWLEHVSPENAGRLREQLETGLERRAAQTDQ